MVLFLPSAERSLDSYLAPKEVVMHATALLVTVFLLSGRRLHFCTWDLFLWLALAASALSGALGAVNGWWAHRAFSLSCSGAALLLGARQIGESGQGARVLGGVGIGLCALAAMTLAEAHGLLPDLSMPGRMPGGAGGNRNFTAHLLVLGLPVLVYLTRRDQARQLASFVWCAGLCLSACAVVLSRSRGAWLGGSVAGVTILAVRLLRPTRMSGAELVPVGAIALGVLLALVPPAAVVWRAPAPYLDTLVRLFQADAGTGRGRIIQYSNTFKMAAAHPFLGVGPGNWSVAYPRYASSADPSYQPAALQPVNRLPSSDWLGLVAERGVVTLVLLLAAAVALVAASFRARRAEAAVALPILGAAIAMGGLDAVVLRPEPVFLISLVLGVSLGGVSVPEITGLRRTALTAGLALGLISTTFAIGASLAQVLSLRLRRHGDRGSQEMAAALDPGDQALQARLAHEAAVSGDCARARVHEARARSLFPWASGLSLSRRLCDVPSLPGDDLGYRIVSTRGPLTAVEMARASGLVEAAYLSCVRRFDAAPPPGLVVDLNPRLQGLAGRFTRSTDAVDHVTRSSVEIRYPDLHFLGLNAAELITHELCHDHAPYQAPFSEGVAEWGVGRAWGIPLAPWWGQALQRAGLWAAPDELFVTRTYSFQWDTEEGRAAYYIETPLLVDFMVRRAGWAAVSRLLTRDLTAVRSLDAVESLYARELGLPWSSLKGQWEAEIRSAIVPVQPARKLLFSVRLYTEVKRFEQWERTAPAPWDLSWYQQAFGDSARARDQDRLDEAEEWLRLARRYAHLTGGVSSR
jgi:hypothetical protein